MSDEEILETGDGEVGDGVESSAGEPGEPGVDGIEDPITPEEEATLEDEAEQEEEVEDLMNDLAEWQVAVENDYAVVCARHDELVEFMTGNEVMTGTQISLLWERRRGLETAKDVLKGLIETF